MALARVLRIRLGAEAIRPGTRGVASPSASRPPRQPPVGQALGRSQGLVARYYDTAAFEGPAQPSWAAACDGCTRVDPQIAFGPRGYTFTAQYFPLFFANDSRTRTWSAGAATSTDGYAFSADWNGFLSVPGPARLRLEGTRRTR